jgi:hypothetical protein
VVAQLARSLLGFQQQAYVGGELRGGYSGVTVNGVSLIEDTKFYQDVSATLAKDTLYRANIGGDANFFDGDGSQWARIADFDGKEAYFRDYMNFLSDNRGANGALVGIVTPDVNGPDFGSVPNW